LPYSQKESSGLDDLTPSFDRSNEGHVVRKAPLSHVARSGASLRSEVQAAGLKLGLRLGFFFRLLLLRRRPFLGRSGCRALFGRWCRPRLGLRSGLFRGSARRSLGRSSSGWPAFWPRLFDRAARLALGRRCYDTRLLGRWSRAIWIFSGPIGRCEWPIRLAVGLRLIRARVFRGPVGRSERAVGSCIRA